MTHPSLGLPPPDLTRGHPAAAERLREAQARLGVRGLEVAIDRDPTLRTRHDELTLRTLLRDTEVFIDRLALCVAGDDPQFLGEFGDHIVVPYRRRRVPLDDAINLLEGIRSAARGVLSDAEMRSADAGIDAAIANLRWHRRLAGDHKRNPILDAIYKGG